jgi:hypothetical protein
MDNFTRSVDTQETSISNSNEADTTSIAIHFEIKYPPVIHNIIIKL